MWNSNWRRAYYYFSTIKNIRRKRLVTILCETITWNLPSEEAVLYRAILESILVDAILREGSPGEGHTEIVP